jgi:hypothetical protein
VAAELFHGYERKDRQTDRRTNMTKLIVAFRYLANVPRNRTLLELVGPTLSRHTELNQSYDVLFPYYRSTKTAGEKVRHSVN